MSRGKFITLEGGEGVGKSTQAALVAEAICKRGINVVTTREPGGTPGAEAIRALLMSGHEERWSARAEALLFAAARADHVERVIRPATEAGVWVICDRFLDSTRAYQGGAGGMSDNDILMLHRIGSDGLMPDRTLLLTLPAQEAEARTSIRDNGHADRFGARSVDYHSSLARAFEKMAGQEAARFRVIDASGSDVEVRERMLAALEDLF